MKRSLLSRLRTNGIYYLAGALLLLIGIPLFQILVLNPEGYSRALNGPDASALASYLSWIGQHALLFLIYRFLLAGAFALLLTLPFSLFRIIVAQEIMAQQEQAEGQDEAQAADNVSSHEQSTPDRVGPPSDRGPAAGEAAHDEQSTPDAEQAAMMPADAWRGKGFVVVAAWSGLAGLAIYLLGTIISTLYLMSVTTGAVPSGAMVAASFFSIMTNTVGIGFIALSTLFFGAMIARGGLRLWPGIWVAFGYVAIAVTALSSGSAVALASAPLSQSPLTTPAIIFFALWVLWFGIMLVRLKPSA